MILMSETMVFPYEIRWAEDRDWSPAMRMIWETFLKYEGEDYTKEGIHNFFRFITDEDLRMAFERGEYKMLLALDGKRIIGAASLRNIHQLSLLFVDEAYHKQGVGRKLLETLSSYLITELGERYMSLNASPYAVEFYRKCGFRAVRKEERYAGIIVTPMEKYFY